MKRDDENDLQKILSQSWSQQLSRLRRGRDAWAEHRDKTLDRVRDVSSPSVVVSSHYVFKTALSVCIRMISRLDALRRACLTTIAVSLVVFC